MGSPDPEKRARAKGGMFQQTSLFEMTPVQQVFGQVAWCAGFSFKLCFWALPDFLPLSILCCIVVQGKREIREAIKHLNWFRILAGFFLLQWPDVCLCLQFSGKIKIMQGRALQSPELLKLVETSEILTFGLLGPWEIQKGGRRPFYQLLWEKCLLPRDGNGWLVSEGDRGKRPELCQNYIFCRISKPGFPFNSRE